MGDVNPQESERIPLKPREIAQAITRGNSLLSGITSFKFPGISETAQEC